MDHATTNELEMLRQESRKTLEQAWARTEQLQAEGSTISNRFDELEGKLARLKMTRSSFSSSSHVRGEKGDQDSFDASGRSGKDNLRLKLKTQGDFGSNKRMLLTDMPGCESSLSLECFGSSHSHKPRRRRSSGNSEDSFSGRSKLDMLMPSAEKQRMMRRESCGGRVEAGELISPRQAQEQQLEGKILRDEDRRIMLMIHERTEKVKYLTEKVEDKEEELEQMRYETECQQLEIQKENAALEKLEAPHRLESLQREVSEKGNRIHELEQEIEVALYEMTEEQHRHLTLENEWDEQEDLVDEAESNSTTYLMDLNVKLQKYRDESEAKAATRSYFFLSSRESVESMRQNLMEHLTPAVCTRMIKALQDQLESLLQKEQDLSSFLMDRIVEKETLATPKMNIEKLNVKCAKLLHRIKGLLEDFDRISNVAHLSEERDVTDAVDQLENLRQLVTDNLLNLQVELASRSQAIEDQSTTPAAESVNKLALDGERLAFTIIAKVQQVTRSLPNAVNKAGIIQIAKNVKEIAQLEERVKNQERNLESFETQLRTLVGTIVEDVSEMSTKYKELEETKTFMIYGLKEKDRILQAIDAIIIDRESSVELLIQEIQDLLIHAEISEQVVRRALET